MYGNSLVLIFKLDHLLGSLCKIFLAWKIPTIKTKYVGASGGTRQGL
jgi:hypothetical protein